MVLTHTDFPDPVAPAIRRCGIFARSATWQRPAMSFPRARGRSALLARNCGDSMVSRKNTISGEGLGTSTPTAPRPGMGATMRMDCAFMASARSASSEAMRDTLIPGAGDTSNWVTAGPVVRPTISPSILKVASLSTSTCPSLSSSSRLRASSRAGGAVRRRVEGRSWLSGSPLSAGRSSVCASATVLGRACGFGLAVFTAAAEGAAAGRGAAVSSSSSSSSSSARNTVASGSSSSSSGTAALRAGSGMRFGRISGITATVFPAWLSASRPPPTMLRTGFHPMVAMHRAAKRKERRSMEPTPPRRVASVPPSVPPTHPAAVGSAAAASVSTAVEVATRSPVPPRSAVQRSAAPCSTRPSATAPQSAGKTGRRSAGSPRSAKAPAER